LCRDQIDPWKGDPPMANKEQKSKKEKKKKKQDKPKKK
jgi:hypothetical protein